MRCSAFAFLRYIKGFLWKYSHIQNVKDLYLNKYACQILNIMVAAIQGHDLPMVFNTNNRKRSEIWGKLTTTDQVKYIIIRQWK